MSEPDTLIAPREVKRIEFCRTLEENLTDENEADSKYAHLQNLIVANNINDNIHDTINEIREDEASHAQTLRRIYGKYCR